MICSNTSKLTGFYKNISNSLLCIAKSQLTTGGIAQTCNNTQSHCCSSSLRCRNCYSQWQSCWRDIPKEIYLYQAVIPDKRIQIPSTLFFDWVAGEEATEGGRVVAVVVVDEVEFGVVIFRGETERIEGNDVKRGGRIAMRAGGRAEGRVVAVRADTVRG